MPERTGDANAQMDLSIAKARAILDDITDEIRWLHGALDRAGWTTRLSDGEMTSPDKQVRVQTTYAGGEFTCAISRRGSRMVLLRITPALFARQPECVTSLTTIVIAMGAGAVAVLHVDAGGTPCGLSYGDTLFGERAFGQADDEPDPADRDDDVPPDMSGSPGHDDR